MKNRDREASNQECHGGCTGSCPLLCTRRKLRKTCAPGDFGTAHPGGGNCTALLFLAHSSAGFPSGVRAGAVCAPDPPPFLHKQLKAGAENL